MRERHYVDELRRAEFFTFIAYPTFGQPALSMKHYYDPEPNVTEQKKALRLAYYKSVHPDWPNVFWGSDLFHMGRIDPLSIPPDLVTRRVGFRRRLPKKKLPPILMYPFFDFVDHDQTRYEVISEELKHAIDTLEPGVHEFFPLEVVFEDGVLDRFIIRTRQNLRVLPDKYYHNNSTDVQVPYRVKARRSALSGRHWVRHIAWDHFFVSRQMALSIKPLLTGNMELVPVTMID